MNSLALSLTRPLVALLALAPLVAQQHGGGNGHQGGNGRTNAATFPLEFRTIDGRDNNPERAEWGAAGTALVRYLSSDYQNGVDTPAGAGRPSAREISNLVAAQSGSIPNAQQASDFVKEQATTQQARNLFRAIMRRGDQIAAVKIDDGPHRLTLDPVHWVVSVLLDCLKRIDDPTERFRVLSKSVTQDAGLLTTAELLEVLEYRVELFAVGKETPTNEANTAKLLQVLKILDACVAIDIRP